MIFLLKSSFGGLEMVAGKDRPYILVSYRKEWLEIFKEIKKTLLEEIFDNQFIEVHHFGSASIPNIELAKPQIDVLAVCKSLDAIRFDHDILEILEILLGVKVQSDKYTPTLDEVYCTKDDELSGMRQVSLHIMQEGDYEIQRPLIFRNYLIHNPDALADYVALKEKLYRKYPNSHRDYDREKGRVIKEVLWPKALVWHEAWENAKRAIKILSPNHRSK